MHDVIVLEKQFNFDHFKSYYIIFLVIFLESKGLATLIFKFIYHEHLFYHFIFKLKGLCFYKQKYK